MASLPPPPINDSPGSFAWLEWYRQLRNYVSTSGSVPWYIVNFSGSNITDIALRDHNQLQNVQGGGLNDKYHVTSSQFSDIAKIATIESDLNALEASLAASYSGSVAIAKLTPGGVNGTLTFVNGVLTTVTPAT